MWMLQLCISSKFIICNFLTLNHYSQVYIPKPKQIGECSSKSWFLNQIQKNYNNIQLALLINGLPYRCNFSVYQKRINEMKQRTVQLVEAYFSCNEVDCSSAIMAAYQNFVDYRNAEFNPFTRCSFTNYNTDCAQVLIQARPPAYGTAENILVGLLTCAKLKLETHCGSQVWCITWMLLTIFRPVQSRYVCNYSRNKKDGHGRLSLFFRIP